MDGVKVDDYGAITVDSSKVNPNILQISQNNYLERPKESEIEDTTSLDKKVILKKA